MRSSTVVLLLRLFRFLFFTPLIRHACVEESRSSVRSSDAKDGLEKKNEEKLWPIWTSVGDIHHRFASHRCYQYTPTEKTLHH